MANFPTEKRSWTGSAAMGAPGQSLATMFGPGVSHTDGVADMADVLEAVEDILGHGGQGANHLAKRITQFTPTLRAATTNPTLSNNASHLAGIEYVVLGGYCIGQAWARFGTAGRNHGDGIYGLEVPFPCAMSAVPGSGPKMTSHPAGTAHFWRGDNSLDLIDAHVECLAHFAPGHADEMRFASSQWHKPGRTLDATGGATNNIAAAGATLGSVTIPYLGRGQRFRARASVEVGVDTVADRSVYAELRDATGGGGSRLHTNPRGHNFAVLDGAFSGGGGIEVASNILEPTADFTVYLNVLADAGGTFDVFDWRLEIEAIPGYDGSDYADHQTPWDWAEQAGQAEIWVPLFIYPVAVA